VRIDFRESLQGSGFSIPIPTPCASLRRGNSFETENRASESGRCRFEADPVTIDEANAC
jgi:hypothetical protein